MAFLRLKNRGDAPEEGVTSKKSGGHRWVVVPAVGAALALWSVATMAGLYSVSTSLTAASNGLPQSLLAPRSIVLGDQRRKVANAWAPRLAANGAHKTGSLTRGCDAGCLRLAASFASSTPNSSSLVHEGKAARLKPAPDSVSHEKVVAASAADVADRFDSVIKRAGLSPQKLADAFRRAENAPVLLASLPSASRFGGAADSGSARSGLTLSGPAESRFGGNQVDVQRASELALALANVIPEEAVDVPTAVALVSGDAPEMTAGASGDDGKAEVQVASLPPQDGLPDSIAVPGLRPRTALERATEAPEQNAARKPEPAKPQASQAARPQIAKPESAKPQPAKPQPTVVDSAEGAQTPRSLRSSDQALPGVQGAKPIEAAPAKRSKAQASEMLAYAKPDTPERGGLGNAFRGLFNSPSTGNGVAVYDISTATVYMPDGSKLEAHSGKGAMADQPRFANRKNSGPTPPDTYNLSLRESRFHGVEAIRLTPTSGRNKYNRNGLLAHTYLLRGAPAQSSGCVAFKDYGRFLSAFKKGKIKRLVVVPRLNGSPTQVAQEGRQG
ncbi:tlde1 domain-containing protein [Mesorhizobium sp.]|uniref:tlde1 domain-containing protein n=1 Tax=Mesorhizobium sp. TaxID=1871066 RepID=UPI0025BF5A11|nr:tlde1 domain-containing protein [Mesorhizobium sp.]